MIILKRQFRRSFSPRAPGFCSALVPGCWHVGGMLLAPRSQKRAGPMTGSVGMGTSALRGGRSFCKVMTMAFDKDVFAPGVLNGRTALITGGGTGLGFA